MLGQKMSLNFKGLKKYKIHLFSNAEFLQKYNGKKYLEYSKIFQNQEI